MRLPFVGRSRKGSYRRVGDICVFDRSPRNFLLKEDLPPAIQRVGDAIVRVCARDAQGKEVAGTGLNLGGVVLTALHTVQGAKDINLVYERQTIWAREIARDEGLDLVLLEPENSPPAPSVDMSVKGGVGDGELYVFGYLFLFESREGKSTTYRERMCAYRIEDRASRVTKDDVFDVAIPIWALDFFRGFSGGMLVDGEGSIRGMLRVTRKIPNLICGVNPSYSSYISGLHSGKLLDFLKQYNNSRV